MGSELLFEVTRGVQGFDAPVYHDGYPVAVFGLVHVVSGYKDSDAPVRRIVDKFPELTPRYGVYPAGGFVQEYDSRFVEDGYREGELLFPSQRECLYKCIALVGNSQPVSVFFIFN